MLRTVEAEISTDGTVTLLEPVEVKSTSRALVTVLENGNKPNNGNNKQMLELLKNPEFKNRQSYSDEVIDSQIDEARNSWNEQNLS